MDNVVLLIDFPRPTRKKAGQFLAPWKTDRGSRMRYFYTSGYLSWRDIQSAWGRPYQPLACSMHPIRSDLVRQSCLKLTMMQSYKSAVLKVQSIVVLCVHHQHDKSYRCGPWSWKHFIYLDSHYRVPAIIECDLLGVTHGGITFVCLLKGIGAFVSKVFKAGTFHCLFFFLNFVRLETSGT